MSLQIDESTIDESTGWWVYKLMSLQVDKSTSLWVLVISPQDKHLKVDEPTSWFFYKTASQKFYAW